MRHQLVLSYPHPAIMIGSPPKRNSISLQPKRSVAHHRNSYVGSAEHDSGPYALKTKIASVKDDLKNSQESFISRERAYKTRMSELEEELAQVKNRKTGWMKTSATLNSLKEIHSEINERVELVQGRTSQIVAQQEAIMLETYRSRLQEIQLELDKEKGKVDDGSIGWIEKGHKLENEIESLKKSSDLLERMNQHFGKENKTLLKHTRLHDAEMGNLKHVLLEEIDVNAKLKEDFKVVLAEHDELEKQVPYVDAALLRYYNCWCFLSSSC